MRNRVIIKNTADPSINLYNVLDPSITIKVKNDAPVKTDIEFATKEEVQEIFNDPLEEE